MPTTLVDAWIADWRAHPTRPVVHDPVEGWVTAGELEERTTAVARRLFAVGLRADDRVLLSGANSIDLVVAHVACLRAGGVVVPVNRAYRRPEVTHVVRDCTPAIALVDEPDWRTWIEQADSSITVMTTAVEIIAEAVDDGGVVGPPRADDPAMIVYTSGTTGAPKGAVLTHANVFAGADSVRLAWRWDERDRLVLCLPLFHMHGLGVGLHGTLLAGASLVLLDGFDPDRVLDAARDHDATLFFGVPTMYHRLASSPRAGELARMRLCVSGSAPLPAWLHERLESIAGVRVLERYGMTETVMLTSNPCDGERRPGTVGLPLPGVEVRLHDGDQGEIEVRGPNVFPGYWQREDATRASFTADGFFRTGDLGELDERGYLRIVGRSKELIISGGYNVYPREVEDVLATHPAFAEVTVAGRPSEEWGEEVTAFVVLRPGEAAPEVAAVRAWAADRLAPFKLPRAIVVLGELPRNALGKVVKAQLPAAGA